MWKTFLAHRLNILQLFANTDYSTALFFIGTLYKIWTAKESLFNLQWFHHNSCQGIQMCSMTYHLFGDRFFKNKILKHIFFKNSKGLAIAIS